MKKRKQIHIPIEDLKVSKANMRKERKAPIVVDILASIEKIGVISPLLVREENGAWGIVAGRRRWHCLKLIAKASGKKLSAPCIVLDAGDDAAAIEASLMENIGRLPPTEMQQYEAFGKLADEGRSVEDIAHVFGITELSVRRVLALAKLAPAIRKLYANEDINRDTAKALTLATPAQQAEWLQLYQSETERAPSGVECKRWVTGGTTISTAHALFNVSDYAGAILEDLFGDNAVFANPVEFWEAQSPALAERVDAYKEAGWQSVTVMERGEMFHSWRHVKCARTKGGRVYVEVCHSGRVQFHEGYITEAEHRKSLRAKAPGGKDTAPQKPEISGPMVQYIGEHRSRTVKADLLSQPGLALRLTVAHMLQGSANFGMREHKIGRTKDTTLASVEDAQTTKIFETERKAITGLLVKHGDCFTDRCETDQSYRLCRTFTVLLKLNDAEVNRCMTFLIASSLEAGASIVEGLSHVMNVDHAAHWQPDSAFFELLRDKQAINAMLGDIATPAMAKSMLTDTGKVQKQAILNRFTGVGVIKAASTWRPKWMQVTPSRYLDGARNPIVEAWETVSELFGKVKPIKRSDDTVPFKNAA